MHTTVVGTGIVGEGVLEGKGVVVTGERRGRESGIAFLDFWNRP